VRGLSFALDLLDTAAKENVHGNDQKKCDEDDQCEQSVFSYLHGSVIKNLQMQISFQFRAFASFESDKKRTGCGQKADQQPDQNLTCSENQVSPL
jgi:hypothetical protein